MCHPYNDNYQPVKTESELDVLKDIRDELRKLNAVMTCKNAMAIPSILREIELNTKRLK